MSFALLFEQLLNGLQFGVTLFLMAAGLTLVLRHHELRQPGARLALHGRRLPRARRGAVDRLLPARRGCSGLAGTLVVGMLVEVVALRTLYDRDHLDQVLATFGLILFFNELVAILWGRAALFASVPPFLSGHIELFTGSSYPLYRAAIIVVGFVTAVVLWYVVTRTRLGMLIRAGATNRTMVAALGINIRLLYTLVFGFGAALAGPGRADGRADLQRAAGHGRADPDPGVRGHRHRRHRLDPRRAGRRDHRRRGRHASGAPSSSRLLSTFISPTAGEAAGPALASMLIYLLMAGGARPSGRRACFPREDEAATHPVERGRAAADRAAAVRHRHRPAVLPRPRAAHPDPRHRRGEPEPDPRLRRPGVLRPCRLPRHRRLRGRHPRRSTASPAAGCSGRSRSRASAVVALAIGAVSIRTSGIYFIMITLAFTQMLYYLGISLEEYGGDDGMRLKAKSQFSGLVDLRDPVAFYYLCLALMLLAVFITYRIVNSQIRHGAAREQVQRRAHARHRLLALPVPPRRVRHRRRDVRPVRRAVRQPHELHHARPDELAAVGRHHVHGDPRRHGDHRRAGARHVRAAAWWRSCSRAGRSTGR